MSGLAKQFSTMKHEAKRAKSACSTVTFSGQQILDVFDALEAMQRDRAELSDKLNGTPCAEIRWRQERDDLRALLVRAGEALEIAHSVIDRRACSCAEFCELSDNKSIDDVACGHRKAAIARDKMRPVTSAIRAATQTQETEHSARIAELAKGE